jgi:hypothetical protein
MKWLVRLLLVSLSVSLLSSCGGTATGNPGNAQDHSAPNHPAGEGCNPDPYVCPDGTLVYRQGATCEFDPCPE